MRALVAAILLSFGYCIQEVVFEEAITITCAVVAVVGVVQGKKLPVILFLTFVAMEEYGLWTKNDVASMRWLLFSFLAFVVSRATKDNDLVHFIPYEQAVRRLVARHDPSQLHRVDAWLQESNGPDLLRRLQRTYSRERATADTATDGIRDLSLL